MTQRYSLSAKQIHLLYFAGRYTKEPTQVALCGNNPREKHLARQELNELWLLLDKAYGAPAAFRPILKALDKMDSLF